MQISRTICLGVGAALLLASAGCASSSSKKPYVGPTKSALVTADLPPLVYDWPLDVQRYWVGPDFWANRVQDWQVTGGRLVCLATSRRQPLRTAHCITREIAPGAESFHISVRLGLVAENNHRGWSGIIFGVGGGELDHKRAAMVHHNPGPGGGILAAYKLIGGVEFFDNNEDTRTFYRASSLEADGDAAQHQRTADEDVRLDLRGTPAGDGLFDLRLSATDLITGRLIDEKTLRGVPEADILGGIGLFAHPKSEGEAAQFWFDEFRAGGAKVAVHPERAFGPVASTLYSLADKTLKLSAQFVLLGEGEPLEATLQKRLSGTDHTWQEVASAQIVIPGWTALFRCEDWDDSRAWDFRVVYRDGEGATHRYSGVIGKPPTDQDEVVMAAYTGMMIMGIPADFSWGSKGYGLPESRWIKENLWFPHEDIVRNTLALGADILFFTGDQIYDSGNPTAGDSSSLILDYMNRWYYWCWAFGELTRQMPAILQVDDHDVYQSNIWGWGGKRNTARDVALGGYLQGPAFVNMVQRVQCGHDPDPYDPTPVEQGITVYYTGFEYGGVGFAVIEDRKFKTPPGYDGDRPVLLGDRQQRFLAEWAEDWENQDLKVCVSQTNFGSILTYAGGGLGGSRDTNAAPVEGRRRALKSLRVAGAVVVAGDTHLATLVRAGIDTPTDGVYMFTVPPVANKFRRWFDPAWPGENHPDGAPNYVGDFTDRFGNPMRVLAVANPTVSQAEVESWNAERGRRDSFGVIGREFVRDGFGIVRLNKRERTVRFECWPWNADITEGDAAQFEGWPVTIRVEAPLKKRQPRNQNRESD